MRSLVLLSALSLVTLASCANPADPADPAAAASRTGPLSHDECERVIRRSLYNLDVAPGTPMHEELMASCVVGKDHYTRKYFDCVFASKYGDAMDCAYAERGVDRSKTVPELASRQASDYGSFEQSVRDGAAPAGKGEDPHTSIDAITRAQYLDQRDKILLSLGETPPADRHRPSQTTHASVVANGKTYWVVREDFQDVQLVKILHEEPDSVSIVTCVRYGSSERIDLGKGYCGALVSKYFRANLAQ